MSSIVQLIGAILVCIGLFIFLSVFILGRIRSWWLSRRQPVPVHTLGRVPAFPKESPMARTRDDKHTPEGDLVPEAIASKLAHEKKAAVFHEERAGSELVAAPYYEASINDYHEARKQDQALNGLAMQLIDMQRMPWAVMPIEPLDANNPKAGVINLADVVGKDNTNQPASSILALIRMLTSISQPIASGGSARNNSSRGDTLYVQLNTVRLTCTSEAELQAKVRSINADTFKVLLPLRRSLLREIKDHATGKAQADTSTFKWCSYAGTGHCAFARSKEDAERLCTALNGVYLLAAAPIMARLQTSIAEWADQEIESMQPLFDGEGVVEVTK